MFKYKRLISSPEVSIMIPMTELPPSSFGNLDVFDDFIRMQILSKLDLFDLVLAADVNSHMKEAMCDLFVNKYSGTTISLDATTEEPYEPRYKFKPVIRINNPCIWFKLLRNFGKHIKHLRIESLYYRNKKILKTWRHMFEYVEKYCRLDLLETLELRGCPKLTIDRPLLRLKVFHGFSPEIPYGSLEFMPNLRLLSLSHIPKSIDRHFPSLKRVYVRIRTHHEYELVVKFIKKNEQLTQINLRLLMKDHFQRTYALKRFMPNLCEYSYVKSFGSDLSSYLQCDFYLFDYAEWGSLSKVQKMVELGADVNFQYTFNLTPLHNAAMNGHFEIVKYLVERGANINCRTSWWRQSRTPLQFALIAGHFKIAEYLLSQGASADTTFTSPLVGKVTPRLNCVIDLECKEIRDIPPEKGRKRDLNRWQKIQLIIFIVTVLILYYMLLEG